MTPATATLATVTLGFGAGLALGLLYFGALWISLRRFAATRSARRFLLGLALRLALALGGFGVLIAATRADPAAAPALLAAVAGFVVARVALTRVLARPEEGGRPCR